MAIDGILFDQQSEMYILLLKQIGGNRTLPIWIGKPEADSIALALNRIIAPRPLTHDLIKNIFRDLNIRIDKIVIKEIVNNTFYADICGNTGKKDIIIDSRPSDAIAIAIRLNVPIFIEEKILEIKNSDESDLDTWLKNLKPEDFGSIM